MDRCVLLLRGINLGAARRVPMAQLRALLADAGYEDVETHLQSGNVVLGSDADVAGLEEAVSALIADRFGLEVPVVGRTADELAAVVASDPLRGVAGDPRRYQVTFLAGPPAPGAVRWLTALVAGEERLVARGRELFSWHPDGIARSRLALALTAKELGVSATARNWATVTALARMAAGAHA